MRRREAKNQKKKDFLWQYQSASRRLDALRMQLKALNIEEYSLRGISYEGGDMPKGHTQTDLSDVVIKIKEQKDKLRAQITEAVRIQNAVIDVINAQDDATEMMVLTCKYIRGMQWKEISAEIGLNSNSRPREIHGEALEKLHWSPPENTNESADGI